MAVAKSWKNREFSPCGWKDTASSWLQALTISKQSKRLARSGCIDVCPRYHWKNCIILHCNPTHAPIIWLLLTWEAGKSMDHDDCGLALRCIKSRLIIWVPRHGSDVKVLIDIPGKHSTGCGTLQAQYTFHGNWTQKINASSQMYYIDAGKCRWTRANSRLSMLSWSNCRST